MIDANSRAITIPVDFKKNGIAVQGDEVAEIVYFKINRYFDFMDFNNAEIYIQWEQAGSNSPKSGVSKEWVRDIESDPDYLIFGWPLDSSITEDAGPIKFSVRFIQWDEKRETIVYSFSTLDAIATINPALDFDKSNLVAQEDTNNMIRARLKNTKPSGGSTADAPIYLLSLSANTEVNLNANGNYVFKVQAYSPDAGILSYSWKIDALDGTSTNDVTSDYEYMLIEDKNVAIDSRKLYYAKNIDSEGKITYSTITVTQDDKIISDLNVEEVYEKFAILTATGTGKYYAIVTNRVNASTEKNISGPVTIPAPGDSTFEPNGDVKIMSAENNYEVILAPIVSNNTTDTLTYQWLKNNAIIDGANDSSYIVKGDGVTADLQGNYALRVTASLNNDNTITTSNVFKITYPAAKPVVKNTAVNNAVVVNKSVTVEVDYINNYHLGNNEETYQWYYATVEGILTNKISGATEATYTAKSVDIGKLLICQVTNHYNGTTATGNSDLISVVSA